MSKTAFLFPGQGSQLVGMGKDFFEAFVEAKALYEKANEILGSDLTTVSFEGPEDMLKQTRFTQPALYVNSLVIADLLKQKGIVAEAAAGHSLGEFSALAYAGAFSYEDGLALVKVRAELMQEAGENQPGTMAAIVGMEAEDVMSICIEVREKGIVQPANYNSPQQIVISGSVEGVNAAMELAKERGAKRVVALPVSGAFHSPLMVSAVDRFGEALDKATFQMVSIPVYANVTAVAVSNAEEIKNLLHHQLTHSVRWVETIQNMIKSGITRFIEVGSGKVLSGLVKRVSRDVEILQCGTMDELEIIGA